MMPDQDASEFIVAFSLPTDSAYGVIEIDSSLARAAPAAGSRGTQLSLADIPSLPVASGRRDPSGEGSLAVSFSTASAAIASSLERLELPEGYASFWAPMARAVIGGLVTSTLLTLLVVPVVTSHLDGAATRLRRLFRGRPTQP